MHSQQVGWTARTLARFTGVSAPSVIEWIKQGLVSAERKGHGRKGHCIGVTGLMELVTVIELRQAGLSTSEIRGVVASLRGISGGDTPLAQLTLVISGGDIAWRDVETLTSTTVSALRHPGQRLMVFPAGERHSALLDRLTESDERVAVASTTMEAES